jgi:CRISPR-associated protein Csc1
MQLYDCRLTFHDNLFYETRTMGRLYETGRLLHNIALTYALGLATTDYFHPTDVPAYGEELQALNDNAIYVTPASGIDVRYVLHTFKLGDERTSVFMEKSNQNIPTYGRAKEIAVNSQFRFGILSPVDLTLPRWIRMGLWMSKAKVEITAVIPMRYDEQTTVRRVDEYPLNPGDLSDANALKSFDLVSMRPTNLVEHAEIEADTWWTSSVSGTNITLPGGLQYRMSR